MIFVQEFDARPDLNSGQIREIYLKVAAEWADIWPSNKFMGLFEHKFVGAGRRFLAMWEMPDFSAFDEWNSDWPGVRERKFVELENELWQATANLTSRVMDRCEPA